MKILTVILSLFVFSLQAKNSIEYVFPEKVEKEITQFVKLNDSRKFYIVFDKINNTEYFISVLLLEDKTVKNTKSLVRKTNRFVNIANKKIPIIFQSDTDFLFLGKDDRGRLRRRAVIYHGFEILFTYHGDIIKVSQLTKKAP